MRIFGRQIRVLPPSPCGDYLYFLIVLGFYSKEDKINMSTIRTECNVKCVWGGTLAGVLVRNEAVAMGRSRQTTMKIIGIHGWLDNLNSMLPLAKKLIERHPNYEIFLYDRAGHGFSSHLPKGFDCSDAHNHQDLRNIIQTLGWNKEKLTLIGHSYGAIVGMLVKSLVQLTGHLGIDVLPRERVAPELFWKSIGDRVDKNLQIYTRASKVYEEELTFEKAVEITKSTRPGISIEAAKLLTERSVRQDSDNQLYFTRDDSLSILSSYLYTQEMVRNAVLSMKASVLFIGSSAPEWAKPYKTIELLKEHNTNFEVSWFDGPHHLHMTHVDAIAGRIEQYLTKHLSQSFPSVIENSKL